MDEVKKYYLHKDDFSKLHFEINDLQSYFQKHNDHASKAHTHGFYQFIWFQSKGRHYIDYEIIEHEPNTVVFINTNQIHYFCTDSINDGVLIHFNDFFVNQFNQELAQRFSLSIFNEIGKPYIQLKQDEVSRFRNVIDLINEEMTISDKLQKEQLFFLFCSLLLSIERIKCKYEVKELYTNPDFMLAYSFKKEVYNHKNTFHKIDFYSQLLNTNSKKLTTLVKQYLGDTPATVIQSIKILEAKRKLANKQSSIQEIAFDLGFDQPTYFTKYFKKATGITPKEFQSLLP
jgi:AraC family transcriptional activator of pobA